MNYLPCFSQAVFPSGGPWHLVHWPLLWLGLCLLFLIGAGSIRMLSKMQRRQNSKRALIASITGSIPKPTFDDLKTTPSVTIYRTLVERSITSAGRLKSLGQHIGRRSKGTGKYAPIWFSVFVCAVLVYGASRFRENVVTQHDVAILRQMDNGDFAFVSREEPNGDTFRACPEDIKAGVNTVGLLKSGIGYIAETATWGERGTCKSLLRPEWNFWFKDAANNFQYRRVQ